MKKNKQITVQNVCAKLNRLASAETKPMKNIATALAFLWASLAMAQQGIQGDLNSKAGQDLPGTRERTRLMIEAVQADKPGELDFVDSLNTRLSSKQQQIRQKLWVERDSQNRYLSNASQVERETASLLQANRLQWPSLSTPTEKRWLKRSESKPDIDGGRAVFTPDFSRQRLTLATVIGRAVLDLPKKNPGEEENTPITDSKIADLVAINLPDLVGLGLTYSPVMDQVQAQLESAISRAKQARADLMPRVSARFASGPEQSENISTGFNKHTTSNSSLRITQPLVNLPLISDWMAELKGEQAANWRLQATRETVALAVTQGTINLATARTIIDYSDEQLNQFNQLLEYVQARAKTGVSSLADLERTRTRVLLAQQVRIEQQAQYKNALLEIIRLTGQTPEALQLPYLNQLPPLPATQGELRRVAWDYSYELRALRSEIEIQKQVLGSQQNKLFPVLGLSLERDTGQNSRGINPRQTDSRVMAVMSWDMSMGGKEIYAAKSAASELSNREAKLTEEGERMLQSIDADFASLQSATLRVTAGQAEQLASAAVVESVNAQLKTGRLGSLLEALDAYERHFAARQRLTLTLGQQMQAQAQLLRRIGQLSAVESKSKLAFEPKVNLDIPTAASGGNEYLSKSEKKIEPANKQSGLTESNPSEAAKSPTQEIKTEKNPVVITPI